MIDVRSYSSTHPLTVVPNELTRETNSQMKNWSSHYTGTNTSLFENSVDWYLVYGANTNLFEARVIRLP